MRLVVTGATGFVGRHLVEHLMAAGDDVVGLARRAGSAKCACWTADLLDSAAVANHLKAFAPDGIIHLAGYADAGRSFTEPAETWRGNLDATLALYRAIEVWGGRPRVIFVSSGAVYGTGGTDETSPLLPASPYAASKAAADLASYQVFCHPGLQVIRVRPFNQIGPGQSPRYAAAAFARQLALIEAGQQPPILETGQLAASRDLTDVRDMVRAYRLLMVKGEPGEVYNAASGRSVTMQQVLDQLLRLSGIQVEVRTRADRLRPHDLPTPSVNAEKLRRYTGWSPSIPLDQSLCDVLDDWRFRVRNGSED